MAVQDLQHRLEARERQTQEALTFAKSRQSDMQAMREAMQARETLLLQELRKEVQEANAIQSQFQHAKRKES